MPSSVSRALPDLHAAPPPALSDDLLEEIFLRIASPTDLTRASVACVTFRRLITDPSFLRRYRSLHQPLLLGFLSPLAGFQRATAPHPSARAARAFASAANFNFDDYLPSGRGRRWYPSDVCDGRVLLESFNFDNLMDADLAVCDPLSRHYRLLPPVPTGVQIQEQNGLDFEFEAFLAPCAEKDDETTFRVIFQAYCEEKIVVFVFFSGSGSWSVGASTSWDESGLPECSMESLGNRLYAYGCFYWKMDRVNKLLMLDLSRMMFSIADLPPDHEERSIVMVEAGEGRLGMLSYIDNASDTFVLYYYAK